MAQTTIPVGSSLARKLYAGALFKSAIPESYWGQRMMTTARVPNAPLQLLTDLEKEKGDTISYDIFMQLKQRPTFEDDNLEGNLEGLQAFSDSITISQVRGGVNAGGADTRKKTVNDLRMIAKDLNTDWWRRFFDESCFMYLAGARGANSDFITPLSSTSPIRNSSLVARDSSHVLYAGSASSKATLASNDTMKLAALDKLISYAETEGGGTDNVVRIQPMQIGNDDKYVIVMHNWQANSLRQESGTNGWMDIQKAAITAVGYEGQIFKGALGEYRGAVLHKHKMNIRFTDYGAGGNVAAARATLMGRQALVAGFGSPGDGLRFAWVEKLLDMDNQLAISTNAILNIKRPQFNSADVNSVCLDTAAAKPY